MAGQHEAKRRVSEDITLDCNFDLTSFPAILTSKIGADGGWGEGRLLLTERELYQLMLEIADRFDVTIT